MQALSSTHGLSRLALFLLVIGNAALSSAAAPESPLPRWRDHSGMVFVRGGQLQYRGRAVRVRSYFMDQCEVTNEEYCRFLNDGNSEHWNTDQEIDAVAVPACVGTGRGRHTYKGWEDISSKCVTKIIRRVHANGGIISTMCAGQCALESAKLPKPKAGPESPVAYDLKTRTATSIGPAVAVEAACMLLKQLVRDDEYQSFRRHNPWLFGGKDQFAPRVDCLR